MIAIHMHLAFNHLAVVGVPFAFFIFCYGLYRKNDEITVLAFGLFTILVLLTVLAFVTGDLAREPASKLSGVTHYYLDEHKKYAWYGLGLMIGLGVVSLSALYKKRGTGNIPAWIVRLSAALALASIVALGITANTGGQVRHPEIRSETAAVN